LKNLKSLHLHLHYGIHLDEREPSLAESFVPTRRPGAIETFVRQFLRLAKFHFFFARRFMDCVAASASRKTGMVSLS
jgi:hypothetical protein